MKDIILIYFIDLIYLIILQFAGHVFGKYCLKHRNNILLNFVYGYFVVSSVSAILTTAGFTIAWGVIAVLIFMILYRKSLLLSTLFEEDIIDNQKDYAVTFTLFTMCYLSRAAIHLNYDNGLTNIPFMDYVYYIQHAEIFHHTGIENKLSSRNLLFDNLNYLEPYRYQDAWPMSIFLKLTNYKSLDIYYLVLFPVNFSIVSLTMYEILKSFKRYLSVYTLVILSFLFLFYQSSSFWPYKIGGMMMGLAGYTKLWIHFIIIGVSIKMYKMQRTELGNLMLLLLFFTVPITLSILLYILITSTISIIYTKLIKPLDIFYFVLIVLYAVYLFISKNSEQYFLKIDNTGINISFDIMSYINAIGYKALIFSYLFPPCVIILILKLHKFYGVFKLKNYLPLVYLLISGFIMYVLLHKSNDSIQMFSNLASPIGAFVSFIGIIQLIFLIKNKYAKNISFIVFSIILTFECTNAHIISSHYARHNISSMFDTIFIHKSKEALSKLSNPVGVYLPDKGYGMISEYLYRNYAYNMTLLMGRYYDVVNIKGDSILFDKNRYSNIDREWHKMAINIYGKNHPNTSNLELAFIKDCNIEYMLSFKSSYELPSWLGGLVKEELYDKKSGLRIYLLHEPQ